jgi:asparagine synthase (glutamine-hydrolysing)
MQPDSFNVVSSFLEHFDREHPGQDVLTRMIYNEFKLRLPELLLMRVDKIGMSATIEARVPFLDHELVEFTMDIPMVDKVRGNIPKRLLKAAVRGLIPDQIIDRKKMGFGAPMSQWLRGDFGRRVENAILSSRLLERGWFDREHIRQLCGEHRSGRRDNSLYVWTLYNLTAWYDYWIDGQNRAAAA